MAKWTIQQLHKHASPDVVVPKAQHRTPKREISPAAAQLRREEEMRLQRKFAGLWRTALLNRYGQDAPAAMVLHPEFEFHAQREWRIDFALPAQRLMVEIDGGTFSDERTAHAWGTGITNDYDKQNAAVMAGWRPFRLATDMITFEHVERIFDFADQLPLALDTLDLGDVCQPIALGRWGDDDHPLLHYYSLSDGSLIASHIDLEQHNGRVSFATGWGRIPQSLRVGRASGRKRLVVVFGCA